MGVGQTRQSRSRVRRRRAMDKLTVPTMVACPQCRSYKLPHHVCPSCGYYKGKMMTAEKED